MLKNFFSDLKLTKHIIYIKILVKPGLGIKLGSLLGLWLKFRMVYIYFYLCYKIMLNL